MRPRFGAAALVALICSLAASSSAAAATEFGADCQATSLAPVSLTVTTLSAPPGPLPLTAPSGGVITQVKMRIPDVPLPLPFTAKVLRPAGGNSYNVAGQAPFSAGTGLTVADARVPVQAGDRLGLHGEPFTYSGTDFEGAVLVCVPIAGASIGVVPGDVPLGSTAEFTPTGEAVVPLSAVIEPDADNDGYGDETQDKCPQSAAAQVECPVLVVDSYALATKRSIVVLVAVDHSAPVKVAGSAKLPKGKASLKAVTKTVNAGKIAKFTLKLPGKLRSALKGLAPGRC